MRLTYNLKLFFKILLPFASAQFLGLFVARRFIGLEDQLGISKQVFDITQQNALKPLIGDIIIWLILATVFMIILMRFGRFTARMYPLILTLVIFSGAQVVGFVLSPALGLVFAVILPLLFWLLRSVFVHTIVMILAIAGTGVLLGLSLAPMTAVILLVLFSAYDILAVYRTGHMIQLAKMMIASRSIFGFIIPISYRDIFRPLGDVEPGSRFMILGSGDVLLPMILSVSLVRVSLGQSMIVAGFSCLGLFLMHIIFQNQRVRRPLAALPPIAMVTIVGYLLTFLVF